MSESHDLDFLAGGRHSATQLAQLIRDRNCRVVFAESCTGGLTAALMTAHAGISEFFCGSAVTYRDDTKVQWLSVSPATLQQYSAVSGEASAEMAAAVLRNTPEADVAATITGHLGPDAPAELDGLIFVAVAVRREDQVKVIRITEAKLTSVDRFERQAESAMTMLDITWREIHDSFSANTRG